MTSPAVLPDCLNCCDRERWSDRLLNVITTEMQTTLIQPIIRGVQPRALSVSRMVLFLTIGTAGCNEFLLPFDFLEFPSYLAPLADEIEVNDAKNWIRAGQCPILTLHRFLSTVFGPA
jgi:hypothetical protein